MIITYSIILGFIRFTYVIVQYIRGGISRMLGLRFVARRKSMTPEAAAERSGKPRATQTASEREIILYQNPILSYPIL